MGSWMSWARKREPASRTVPKQRVLLHCDELEDRCTPADFMWRPLTFTTNVSPNSLNVNAWNHVEYQNGNPSAF